MPDKTCVGRIRPGRLIATIALASLRGAVPNPLDRHIKVYNLPPASSLQRYEASYTLAVLLLEVAPQALKALPRKKRALAVPMIR